MRGGALNQTLTCDYVSEYITTGSDVLKFIVIFIIMILIILGNTCCLVVINSARTKHLFKRRVRYLMNSMSLTDLGIGLFMCPTTLYPALKRCWPFGVEFCQIEALVISGLFQQSTINMVLIAIDRYCIVHFVGYPHFLTAHRLRYVIVTSWVTIFSLYSVYVFGYQQFYYDEIGVNCEPYYENKDYKTAMLALLITSFVLPGLIINFCYTSIFMKASSRKITLLASDDKVR